MSGAVLLLFKWYEPSRFQKNGKSKKHTIQHVVWPNTKNPLGTFPKLVYRSDPICLFKLPPGTLKRQCLNFKELRPSTNEAGRMAVVDSKIK